MCLIDPVEARYFLSSPEAQALDREHGYIRGLEVKAPSVISLNTAVAATAVSELAVFISGLRPANPHTELDLLGGGRSIKSQWMIPTRVTADPGCVQCAAAGNGDIVAIDRYAR